MMEVLINLIHLQLTQFVICQLYLREAGEKTRHQLLGAGGAGGPVFSQSPPGESIAQPSRSNGTWPPT